MDLLRFISRSVALAPFVAVRLLVVAIFAGVVAGFVIFAATFNIWALGLVVVVFSLAGSPFLVVQGLRAGLVSLRATEAPTLDGTIRATWKTFLYLLIMVLLILIAMIPLGLALSMVGPGLGAFAGLSSPSPVLTPGLMAILLPVCTYLAAATSLVWALVALPMTGIAANAVQKPPGHDFIWGMTRKFPQLFVTSFLFYGLPNFVLPILILDRLPATEAAIADPQAALSGLPELLAMMFLIVFGGFVQYASAAVAYVDLREEQEQARIAAQVVVFDRDAERDSLKDLRNHRMNMASGKERSVYSPDPTATPGRRQSSAGAREELIRSKPVLNVYDPYAARSARQQPDDPPAPADAGPEPHDPRGSAPAKGGARAPLRLVGGGDAPHSPADATPGKGRADGKPGPRPPRNLFSD
jgi:hypothetical protein